MPDTTSAALRFGLSLPLEHERGLLASDINEMGMNEMGMNVRVARVVEKP